MNADQMATVIVGTIAKVAKPLQERIDALEAAKGFTAAGADASTLAAAITTLADLRARVERIEQRPPSPEYKGIFELGETYGPGDMTTRGGGLWLCLKAETRVQPGTAADRWRLVVKSGGGER